MNYKNIYENLINRSKIRDIKNQYTEKHHIIPLCIGGKNNSDNIVRLTPREHFIAHLLLMKIYPNEYKLVYAAMKMTRGRDGINSSRKYEWLRKKYSEIRKKLILEKSPTRNKKWISNLEETLMVEKDKAEKLVESGKYVYGKLKQKIFFCNFCNKILRNRCNECIIASRKQKIYQKNKDKAEKLYQKFVESNVDSVTKFANMIGTSQPRLTKLWSKYVDEYNEKRKQGKSFKENFSKID